MNMNENACANETQAQEKKSDEVNLNYITEAREMMQGDCPSNEKISEVELKGIDYSNPCSAYNLLETAKSYAKRGWNVVPLYGVYGKSCACSNPDCGCEGKHPVPRDGLKAATTDEQQLNLWWESDRLLNVGVVTGEASDIFVLDIDIKPDKKGDEALSELETRFGRLPDTVEAITGSGGRHLIFKHPGYRISNKQNSQQLGVGIDVRGDGGYIVAPGSKHKSGGEYRWKEGHGPDDLPLADAPDWLLELLIKKEEATAEQGPTIAVGAAASQDRSDLIKRARAYLKKCEPAIEGSGGDAHTFSVAGHLVAIQYPDGTRLSIEEVTSLMLEEWNKRCKPPWKAGDLKKKVESAFTNGTPRAPKIVPSAQDVHPTTGFECTDIGNGKRFVRDHGEDVRYSNAHGWMFWNGTHWEIDETREVERRAKKTALGIRFEEQGVTSETRINEILKWTKTSQSIQRVEAMVRCALSEPEIVIRSEALDADLMLLNCLNGTIDLRTGTLREHRREDLITRMCPVQYDEAADCPEWMNLMDLVTGGSKELQEFIQRALGYSLTGDTGEQCLFFLYGHGKNGKSTFMETISSLLGNQRGYASKTNAETVMVKWGGGGGISNDVARLDGPRFVVTSELEQGKRWSESTVKNLTGGDTNVARFMHKEFFEFKPAFKLWCYGNHKPGVVGTDDGFWRRMKLIPFTVQIPETKRVRSSVLAERLKGEWSGILAWMVRGCLAWQQLGLGTAPEIVQAVQEYRSESDCLGEFIDERIIRVDGARISVDRRDVYREYTGWADECGIKPMSMQKLNKQMEERSFVAYGSGGYKRWAGTMLKNSQQAIIT